MTTWGLILLSVVWFSLSAWLAKQACDLGTVVGKSIGSRLLGMSFAAVAALALWPGKGPISLPSITPASVAAEPQEIYYVALAVDEKQEYHAPGCPDVPQTFKVATKREMEQFGRHPHPECIRQTAAPAQGP